MIELEREPDPRSAQRGDDTVTYKGFLRLEELLSLQSPPYAHDQMMFVIVHQVSELWFKLLLHELESVRNLLLVDALDRAGHLLRRVVDIQQLMIEHWTVLDGMLAADYSAFRWRLKGGSGFESVQYREIEFLSGAKDPSYLEKLPLDDSERQRLLRRLRQPSVREAYLALLDRHGIDWIGEVFAKPGDSAAWSRLHVAELMLDFDNAFAQWRTRHVLMVERQIGALPGTGGSSGASYLRTRLDHRLFPELWEARAEAHTGPPTSTVDEKGAACSTTS